MANDAVEEQGAFLLLELWFLGVPQAQVRTPATWRS